MLNTSLEEEQQQESEQQPMDNALWRKCLSRLLEPKTEVKNRDEFETLLVSKHLHCRFYVKSIVDTPRKEGIRFRCEGRSRALGMLLC